MNTLQTQLYRHFDANGRLLYVGISLSAAARLAQHKTTARWASDIALVKVEKHETREAALAAERKAIYDERPLYNARPGTAKVPRPTTPQWRVDAENVHGPCLARHEVLALLRPFNTAGAWHGALNLYLLAGEKLLPECVYHDKLGRKLWLASTVHACLRLFSAEIKAWFDEDAREVAQAIEAGEQT